TKVELDELGNFDCSTDILSGGFDQFTNSGIRIFNERLLVKTYFRSKFIELTFNDIWDHRFRLSLLFQLSSIDFSFFCFEILIDFRSVKELRVSSGDLHAKIFYEIFESFIAVNVF